MLGYTRCCRCLGRTTQQEESEEGGSGVLVALLLLPAPQASDAQGCTRSCIHFSSRTAYLRTSAQPECMHLAKKIQPKCVLLHYSYSVKSDSFLRSHKIQPNIHTIIDTCTHGLRLTEICNKCSEIYMSHSCVLLFQHSSRFAASSHIDSTLLEGRLLT